MGRLAQTLGLTVESLQTLKIAEYSDGCSCVAQPDYVKVFKCKRQVFARFGIGNAPIVQPLSFVCGRSGKSPNSSQGYGFPHGARSTRCSQFLVGASRRRAAPRSQFVGRPLSRPSGQRFSVGRFALRTLRVRERTKPCKVQQYKLRFSSRVQCQSSAA